MPTIVRRSTRTLQRGRRHEILDGGHVVRDRAEEQPGLVRVEVIEREALGVVE
jgi:hypothetical protein